MPAAKRRKRETVWVVMHFEIMFENRVDSLQFHVASSLRAAEKYIRGLIGISSWSWWQVHPHLVDDDPDADEGLAVHYYSHTGRPLKCAPIRRAISLYQRCGRPKWERPAKPSSAVKRSVRHGTYVRPVGF